MSPAQNSAAAAPNSTVNVNVNVTVTVTVTVTVAAAVEAITAADDPWPLAPTAFCASSFADMSVLQVASSALLASSHAALDDFGED